MKQLLSLGLFGQRRIQPARQSGFGDGGVEAILMIATYHGYEIDRETVRRTLAPSSRGTAVQGVVTALEHLKFAVMARRATAESVRKIALPAILQTNTGHYVVVEAFKGKSIFVHDPNGSSYWTEAFDLIGEDNSVLIECRTSPDFDPVYSKNRLKLSQFWSRITSLPQVLGQIFVLSFLLQIIALIGPYFMQIAIDSVLPTADLDLLLLLALGFGLVAVLNAYSGLLRSFVLLWAGTKLSLGLSTNIARRLIQLPVVWFEQRHIGDILSRFQSIIPIRRFLTEGTIGVIVDGLFAISTLIVMALYSLKLAMLSILAITLYGAARFFFYPLERRAEEGVLVKGAKEQSNLMENLRGITTLRLYNKEMERHLLWQYRLVDSLNATAHRTRIDNWQRAVNDFIFGLETVISTYIAIRAVLDAELTVGMVFAYIAYKVQFVQRSTSLIQQWMAYRIIGLHLERISDIALSERDVSFAYERTDAPAVQGRIEAREVSFRYGNEEPWVLRNLNLTVECGEHVAITGPSGGGKTTLIKLLLGLVDPTEGTILVDGAGLKQLGYRHYRKYVGAVLQDDTLFAGSLIDNVTLFDPNPDIGSVERVIAAAGLEDDLGAMTNGLSTFVGDMGSSLSGGQRQRLLLARALYREPSVLILDEGTSHLDPKREKIVNRAIAALGVTRIVVAHRAETIRQADRVLALREGGLWEINPRDAR